jgi:TolB protein
MKTARYQFERWKAYAGLWSVLFIMVCLPDTAGASEKGSLIALLSHTAGIWQVFVMEEDGSGLRQVTRSAVDKSRISWSNDRDRLLVNTNLGELALVELSSGKETPLDIGVRGMTDAVWSRDGKRVLFSLSIANSVDANDIWMVEIPGLKRRKLTHMTHLQHNPAWAHDERGIVFLSGSGGQHHDIFTLDLRKGTIRQVTAGGLYHFEPVCSVKGEIAFSSNRTGDYEIWVTDLDGKRFEQITRSPGLDAQPTWSPDGERMAFVSTRNGKSAVWMTNRDGTHPRQLSPGDMVCRGPAWSR